MKRGTKAEASRIVEAAEIAVAHVVGYDEHDVGSLRHPHSIRSTTSSVEHRRCSVIAIA